MFRLQLTDTNPQSWGQRDPFPTRRPVKPFELLFYWPACTPPVACSIRLKGSSLQPDPVVFTRQGFQGVSLQLREAEFSPTGTCVFVDLCRVSSLGLKKKQMLHFLFCSPNTRLAKIRYLPECVVWGVALNIFNLILKKLFQFDLVLISYRLIIL